MATDEIGGRVNRLDLDPDFAAALRKIERRVLAEVVLRRRALITIVATILVLAGVTVEGWVTCDVDGVRTVLSHIALGLGVAAVITSTIAVIRRRFGWCWIAGAVSAIAVPMSVLGYWSAQTALHQSSIWLLFAALCHGVLVAQWVQCARPPIASIR